MKKSIIALIIILVVSSCNGKKETNNLIKKDVVQVKKNKKEIIEGNLEKKAVPEKDTTVITKINVHEQKIVKDKEIVIKSKNIEKAKVVVKKNASSKPKIYSFRKYNHVTKFYEKLSVDATRVCMEQNVPPAALLAIAGLESGWNKGYIGQITGNILSLGSSKRRGDIRLPALYLPRLKKDKRILFDSLEIASIDKSKYYMEQRPSSLKKDYRPSPWAGTKFRLGYLEHHPEAKAKAHAQNVTDFVTVFISRTSKISAYRKTRAAMDALVKKHGKKILLKESTAIQFINGIGGKKNSYNFRKTWPIKVVRIMHKAGLVSLTDAIYNGKTFKESW